METWKLLKIFEIFVISPGLPGEGEVLQALVCPSLLSVKAGFNESILDFNDLKDGDMRLEIPLIFGTAILFGDLYLKVWSRGLFIKKEFFCAFFGVEILALLDFILLTGLFELVFFVISKFAPYLFDEFSLI